MKVLKGDIKPAVETHEMLYQVMQRHNFIPEAFTTDFQVIYRNFIIPFDSFIYPRLRGTLDMLIDYL